MSISSQIEAILDRRLGRGVYVGKGRLQQVEKRLNAIVVVKARIHELDALINTITQQVDQQQGEYYTMLCRDPDALSNFNALGDMYSSENGRRQLKALVKLEKLIEKLELLKLRFGRQAVRIAFIGTERQGKSSFIKTITGLTDKVIPAYSGNSCTGAVSVIHNVDRVVDESGVEQQVKVVVEYYNANEFLEMVNEKLRRFFDDGSRCIGRIEQIRELNLPDQVNLDVEMVAEYNKFRESIVENYDAYMHLIGVGVKVYYDEDIIAQHVAQYEEFDEPVSGARLVQKDDNRSVYVVNYYKYVAVKSVHIYKAFAIDATRQLELVDSIGIGSAADTVAIEKEMYRILREDCDAAIDLFRPSAIPSYPKVQAQILDNIERELEGRDPSKWIVYVLNKVCGGPLVNVNAIDQVKDLVENTLKTQAKNPVAWLRAINGVDFAEVRDLLVSPLLQLIAENLESLDDGLVEQTEEIAREAYNACLSLVKAANDVTSAGVGLSADALALFDERLYKELLSSFGREMNNIDIRGYATRRDTECPELLEAYEGVIKNISKFIPSKAVILSRIETGVLLTPNQLFEDYIEQIRNDIFNAFENVNVEVLYPLQERVKSDLIKVLYDHGMMCSLPTPCAEPTTEWLEYVVENYVTESLYPNLYKALRFVLDYQINVEGLVEYNVTRSLYIIDRTHKDFIPYRGVSCGDFDGIASAVWEELYNRVHPLRKQLREWINTFTLIPSHSFYSRVHKFYIKVLSDRGGVEDFRRFYRKNMGLIWSREISAAGRAQKAFGDWTERVNNLRDVVASETFNIN